jgi:glyoxylase-like metal-dependent hydrolase (beta-lactamase superfamily II)
MRVHHLDCVSMCPYGGRLIDGRSARVLTPARLVCHCLLIEHDAGLVLVDTGFGIRDVRQPRPRLSPLFLAQMRPDLREELTAVRQIERLGFNPRDVRHIVLTHLDFDHAGGLDDFPEATVHLLARERDAAQERTTLLDRMRYRPAQWSGHQHWRGYDDLQGEAWFGFESVRGLDGLPPEILLVPLIGHTHGHAGVAVDLGGHWLLHAGDAYFFHGEMDLVRPHCPPGLQLYQRMMAKDYDARCQNLQRLRNLRHRHESEVQIFCAHDMVELERLTLRTAPASARPDGFELGGAARREPDLAERARRY